MTTTNMAVFHGNAEEVHALVMAMARYCECEYSLGLRVTCCTVHQALSEQRWLDGLSFARSMRDRLIREEWTA